MDTGTQFDELARILPGVTTAKLLREWYGDADRQSRTSDDGCFLHFDSRAVVVGFERFPDAQDEVVDEVRLLKGNNLVLKCGLHVGMRRRDATELIRDTFRVLEEYEDSIYFVPSEVRPLVACAEFIEEDNITSLELYIDPDLLQN